MFNDGAFELIDVHAILPELKGRRGMLKWPVINFNHFANYFNDNYKNKK